MTNDHEENAELARLISHGYSYANAGAVLGLSKSTVSRRMQEPAMRQAVGLSRRTEVDNVLTTLRAGAGASVAFLCEVVDDNRRADSIRVRAASQLLAFALRQKITVGSRQELVDALDQLEILVHVPIADPSDSREP